MKEKKEKRLLDFLIILTLRPRAKEEEEEKGEGRDDH